MRVICAAILFVFSVLAFDLAIRIIRHDGLHKPYFRTFGITAIGSGMWSLGYAMMQLFEDESDFLIARDIGTCGLFLFLMAAQFMLCFIGERIEKVGRYLNLEVIMAIVVLILVLPRQSVELLHTEYGIVTAFKSSTVSWVYTLFTAFVAILFIIISVRMIKNTNKNIENFGRRFLLIVGLIILGMIFDTLLPAIGINYNIPFSTMIQFIGLYMMRNGVIKYDENMILIGNMHKYVYKTIRTPLLIFDKSDRLCITNDAAKWTFHLASDDKENQNLNFFKDVMKSDFPEAIRETTDTVEFDADYYRDNRNYKFNVDKIYDNYGDYIGYIINVTDMTKFYDYMVNLKDQYDIKLDELFQMAEDAIDKLGVDSEGGQALIQIEKEINKIRD